MNYVQGYLHHALLDTCLLWQLRTRYQERGNLGFHLPVYPATFSSALGCRCPLYVSRKFDHVKMVWSVILFKVLFSTDRSKTYVGYPNFVHFEMIFPQMIKNKTLQGPIIRSPNQYYARVSWTKKIIIVKHVFMWPSNGTLE